MLLLLAIITTALMAGFFFSWSCSMNPGLRELPDTDYLSAMQSINRKIQNPLFLSCLFGAAILLPVCAYRHYNASQPGTFWFLPAAAGFYLLGVIAVTIFGNIPLNEALDAVNLSKASAGEIAKQRLTFEIPWNRLNTVRTISNLISLILVLLAVVPGKLK